MPRKPRPEFFEVEVILSARVNDEDGWDYLVKWFGYPEDDNSWEPAGNVKQCKRLLESFWEHIGRDDGDDDHPIGYRVNASAAWIKREKEFFTRVFAQCDTDDETIQTPKKSRKPRSPIKSGSVKSKGKVKANRNRDSSDSEPERIIIKVPPLKSLMASVTKSPGSLNRSPRKDLTTSSNQPRKHALPSMPAASAPSDNIHEPPSSPDSLFSKESSAEAPPKSPSKPQRKIKLLDVERSNMSSASSLSTKQRLFQNVVGGSNLTSNAKAKIAPPRPTRAMSFAKLGFKKHPAPPPPRDSGSGVEQSSGDPLVSEEEDFFIGGAVDDILMFDNQQPTEPDLRPVEDRFFAHKSPEPTPLPGPHAVDHIVATARLAADIDRIAEISFPSRSDSIMNMSELASDPVSDDDPVERYALTVSQRTATALPKIPKKWKWSGALLVDTGASYAQKLSAISLSDPTANSRDGLSFDIFLSMEDSIQITRMLNITDLEIIISACEPFRQLARVELDDINDKHALTCLASFMDRQRQVAIGPLSYEDIEAAAVLIFPSTLRDVWSPLKVPIDLQQSGGLVAALIPWTKPLTKYYLSRSLDSFVPPDFKLITSQAIRCLEFPRDLRNYMKMPNHPYCIWWSPGDGTVAAPGTETILLNNIMRACRATMVECNHEKLRVVFVHVGALESLHKASAISKRRQQPEIHFYSYGSHPSIPSNQWGVRAIYPLGGIVTFTPDILVEDPIGTAQLMGQITKHPFWDCYLLPSALGMASRSLCADADPLSEFHEGVFVLNEIVALIAEGGVSLLRAPRGQGDDDFNWVHQQLRLFTLVTPSALLEECLNSFSAQYANASNVDVSRAIKAEIVEDLLRLHSSPSIIENYRRFVVITATNICDSDPHNNLVEWITREEFDTMDGFLRMDN